MTPERCYQLAGSVGRPVGRSVGCSVGQSKLFGLMLSVNCLISCFLSQIHVRFVVLVGLTSRLMSGSAEYSLLPVRQGSP